MCESILICCCCLNLRKINCLSFICYICMWSHLCISTVKVFIYYNRFIFKECTVKCKCHINASVCFFCLKCCLWCYCISILIGKCFSCGLIHNDTRYFIRLSRYKILIINLIYNGCLWIRCCSMCLCDCICCCRMNFRVMYRLSFIPDICMESNLDILVIKLFKCYHWFPNKQGTVKCKGKLNTAGSLFSLEGCLSCNLFSIFIKKCCTCLLIHKDTWYLICAAWNKILIVNLIYYSCLLINSSCMCLWSFIRCCCMDFRIIHCLLCIINICMCIYHLSILEHVFICHKCLSGKLCLKTECYCNCLLYSCCLKCDGIRHIISIDILKCLSGILIC